MHNNSEMVSVSKASERIEAVGGVLIAFFAALMAVSDLVNNNLEEEMMIAHAQQTNYFSWYQSKSIKQSLKESEKANLEAIKLLNPKPEFDLKIEEVQGEIKRYKAEKNEILVGSSQLTKEAWVQDLDGKMGAIIGVKEWEAKAKILDMATQKFDIAALFFQVSLVLGAVCVIIYDNPRLQKAFVALMIGCGTLGIGFSIWGYILAG